MPRDTELDRLRAARDQAFECKQAAWDAQDQAWRQRESAKRAMNQAHASKQQAHQIQQAAWEDLQRVRDRNGPRIEHLNRVQESAYQQMQAAFDRASSAHDARDGASARAYADEGHRHKADSQAAVSERRALIQEIRDARARHDATKPAFQRAKAAFDQAKAAYDRVKADHDRAKTAFADAKRAFEAAENSYKARRSTFERTRQQQREDRRAIAVRAGVPNQYLDKIWVKTEPGGSVNIYFGGVGTPDGPGHGHYAMDASGHVTYRRDPFDPHGTHNYTDKRQRPSKPSTWDPPGSRPPHVGTIAGTDHVVSFKTGGPTGDHTLIADGDYSDRPEAFDGKPGRRGHDHYGSKREKDEQDPDRWIDEDRGKYTGPGS